MFEWQTCGPVSFDMPSHSVLLHSAVLSRICLNTVNLDQRLFWFNHIILSDNSYAQITGCTQTIHTIECSLLTPSEVNKTKQLAFDRHASRQFATWKENEMKWVKDCLAKSNQVLEATLLNKIIKILNNDVQKVLFSIFSVITKSTVFVD